MTAGDFSNAFGLAERRVDDAQLAGGRTILGSTASCSRLK
jgi:hypothetical protein